MLYNQISFEQLQDNKIIIENSLRQIIQHSDAYSKRQIVQKIAFIEELVEEI